MSNTITRIISAIFLLLILFFCFSQGPGAMAFASLVINILLLWEVVNNFIKVNNKDVSFFFCSLISSSMHYYLINFRDQEFIAQVINPLSIVVCLAFADILFFDRKRKYYRCLLNDQGILLLSVVITLPFISLTYLTMFDSWRELLTILLLITIGMDVGGWFFGKKFGKKKLWEKVSPNKTVTGLVGGMLTGGFLSSLGWYYFFKELPFHLPLFFAFFAFVSQVGDLVQSKLKRIVNIKDSSSLIPGHGGVYDRVDGLIFLAPFYACFAAAYFS